jgi:tetratricopeptide (TPR) repeat protein
MRPGRAADNPGVSPFPWNISAPERGGDPRPSPRGEWDAVLRLARAGRPAQAIAALEGLWAAWGTSPSECARELHARLLGAVAAAAGEGERALALLERALDDAPRLADLHWAKARLCRQRGDQAAARAALAAGLLAQPGHPACAVERALWEARSGRLGEAVAELEALGQACPPAAPELFRQAVGRLRAGAWEAAEELLTAAYRTGSHAVEAELAGPLKALEGGDAARALEGALAVTERFPDAPPAHLAVGLAALGLGWPDDALEAFGRALVLDPDCHAARLYFAWAHFLLGETGVAEAEVLLVLAACPGHELALALWRERCGSRSPGRPAVVPAAASDPTQGSHPTI